MRNPCENCLVRSTCMKPCDKLSEFGIKILLDNHDLKQKGRSHPLAHMIWLEEYEIRPRVLDVCKSIFPGIKFKAVACRIIGGIDESV